MTARNDEHEAGWTPERIAQLKMLWVEKTLSMSDIAGIMGGGLTKNGVIGKGKRLRLEARGRYRPILPSKQKSALERGMFNRLTREPREPTKPGDTRYLRGAAWDALPGSSPVPLTDVEGCRWPIGERPPFTFCNEPVAAGSYCAIHNRVSGTSHDQSYLSVLRERASEDAGRGGIGVHPAAARAA